MPLRLAVVLLCLLALPGGLQAAPRPSHIRPEALPPVAAEALPEGWKDCGGFRLNAAKPEDGGWSDMVMRPDGSGLWLVSDHGQILSLNTDWKGDRLSALTPETFRDLPYPPGHENEGRFLVDAEAVTLDSQGRIWIGFERLHRLEAYRLTPEGYQRSLRCDAPDAEAFVHPNSGMESLVWDDASQSLYSIFERRGAGGQSLLRFTPLPEGHCAVSVLPTGYPYSGKYDVSAAAYERPDRWWVVERRFSLRRGFLTRLALFNPEDGTKRILAPLNALMEDENVEGIALRPGTHGLTVLLLSDDNARLWQQTLLRAFCVAPPGAEGGG